jgi:hypothetical protein
VVGPCYIQRMFQRCLVFQSRFIFHEPILVRFPGCYQ